MSRPSRAWRGRQGLHPLQKAFADLGARAVRLLHAGIPADGAGAPRGRSPKPTLDEIKEALAGNLCRCTGYIKIFEAVELAAAWMRGRGTPSRARRRSTEPTSTRADSLPVVSQLTTRRRSAGRKVEGLTVRSLTVRLWTLDRCDRIGRLA